MSVKNGLKAFGALARVAVSRLDATVPIIAFDLSAPAEALHEAVTRRSAGQRFFAMPVLESERNILARKVGLAVVESDLTFDEQREHFAMLAAGDTPYETPLDSADIDRLHSILVARDVLRVADGVITRSWHELDALDRRIGEPHPLSELIVVEREPPPSPASAPANTILIWAPKLPASRAVLHLFALSELHAGVVLVCEDGGQSLRTPIARERYIAASEVSQIHGVASVLVIEEHDPAVAISLCAWNVPLAVSSTSGAREYLSYVTVYDPWDVGSIRTAVLNASGGYPPALRDSLPSVQMAFAMLARAWPVPLVEPPLVSVVIPTKNRAKVLPRAVASILAQTYKNIEVAVLNDGGEDVSGVLPADSRIRYVDEPAGNGWRDLYERCLRLANGTYFCMLCDDDQFSPEHLELAVAALERTGEMMSRSMAAFTILGADVDGYRVLGELVLSPPAYDPTELLIRNSNAGPSVYRTKLLRTRIRARVEAGHLSDLEANLRHLQEFDFVCVRAVTQINDVRRDGSNISSSTPGGADRERLAADYEALYEAFPISGRPAIEIQRAAHYKGVRERAEPPSPLIRLNDPPRGAYSSLRSDGLAGGFQQRIFPRAPRCDVPPLPVPVITAALDVAEVRRWRDRLSASAAGLELARAQIAELQTRSYQANQREYHLRNGLSHWQTMAQLLVEQLETERRGAM